MSAKLFEGFNVSVNYAKYRVAPPQQLITTIIEYLSKGARTTQKWDTAVDVGCGTGQATKLLAPYFERVYGFDCSETQIKEAVNNNNCPNIEYKVAAAESLPVDDNSINLVIASEAVHYFDLPIFYKEVERCLKSDGVLAIFGYRLPDVYPFDDLKNEKFKTIIYDTYKDDLLADYFDPRAKLIIEQGYSSLVLPFNEFTSIGDQFSTTVTVNVTEMMHFISSWSGFNLCSKAKPDQAKKLLENFRSKIKDLISAAESLPLEKQSVNLITASQSAHWFDLPKFYNESKRVLAPNGVVAFFGYKMPFVWSMENEQSDEFKSVIVEAYKSSLLAPHWNKQERSLVDSGYKDIVLPFNDFVRIDDRFKASVTLTFDEMVGYITSWSGFNVCLKKNPSDAKKLLEEFRQKVSSLCGDKDLSSLTFKVVYSFVLLMARVS